MCRSIIPGGLWVLGLAALTAAGCDRRLPRCRRPATADRGRLRLATRPASTDRAVSKPDSNDHDPDPDIRRLGPACRTDQGWRTVRPVPLRQREVRQRPGRRRAGRARIGPALCQGFTGPLPAPRSRRSGPWSGGSEPAGDQDGSRLPIPTMRLTVWPPGRRSSAPGSGPRLESKIVRANSVRQAMIYVQNGDAEAALVSHALAVVPEVRVIEVDAALYDPLIQALGIVAATKQRDRARAAGAVRPRRRGTGDSPGEWFLEPRRFTRAVGQCRLEIPGPVNPLSERACMPWPIWALSGFPCGWRPRRPS